MHDSNSKTYEVTLRSGRKFHLITEVEMENLLTQPFPQQWLRGTELGSIAKPKQVDWLPRFNAYDVETFRRVT